MEQINYNFKVVYRKLYQKIKVLLFLYTKTLNQLYCSKLWCSIIWLFSGIQLFYVSLLTRFHFMILLFLKFRKNFLSFFKFVCINSFDHTIHTFIKSAWNDYFSKYIYIVLVLTITTIVLLSMVAQFHLHLRTVASHTPVWNKNKCPHEELRNCNLRFAQMSIIIRWSAMCKIQAPV